MDNGTDSRQIFLSRFLFFCREKLSRWPCALVLTAVLSVILPGILLPEWSSFAVLPAILLIGAGWYLFGARNAFFQLALPAFAGLCSLFLNGYFRQNDPLTEYFRRETATGIEAKIRICDPSLYDASADFPSYRRVLCRMTAFRFSAADAWIETDSRVLTLFPPEIKSLSYGAVFRVRGILQVPEQPLLPGSFDYRDYLRRRGIHFILQVNQAVKTGERPSFYRILLEGRNRLLHSLTASLPNPENQALAAALLFGCRREINPVSRESFIRSGTIHILTVSGLHIGMFAAAVFLLLLPVPFRLRMILTPVLTLLYGFSTGMQMPAARAVLMLFCWCIPRAFLFRGNGLNSVFLAGSLLLLWNPFQWKDPGFQYSFLCVFFLILSASKTAEWLRLLVEKQHWIPERKQSRWTRLLTRGLIRGISMAAGCLTAWLCSLVLTVFYQGLAAAFALPANLLVIPLVYLVFILFAAAGLPCLLFPVLGKIFSPLLALSLSGIESVCSFFANLNDCRIPAPPAWSVFFGISALLILFGFPGRKAGIAGLCGFLFLLFFWCSGIFSEQGSELLLFYGGRQRIPALALSCPADDFSVAANLADFRHVSAAADYLKQRGHRDLTVLISSGSAREYTFGAQYFPDRMKTRYYLAERPLRKTGTAVRARQKAEERGACVEMQTGKRLRWHSGGQKIETFSENGQFFFDISKNENKVHIQIVPDTECGTEIRLSENGGAVRKVDLPRERNPGILRIKLNW